MKDFNPKTQAQLVMWYLFNHKEVDQKFVINHSFFWKFNTRLSELENKFGTFTKKEYKSFTNRFNHKGKYLVYSISNKDLANKVLNELI